MARYIKTYKDAKKRHEYNAKSRRKNKINEYLGKALNKLKGNNLKNYCQVTGSARSYYKQFAISRHCFRKNLSFGLLPGVMKSSW